MKNIIRVMLLAIVLLSLLSVAAISQSDALRATTKVKGYVLSVDTYAKTISLQTSNGGTAGPYTVSAQAKIKRNGKPASLANIQQGDSVELALNTTTNLVDKIEAKLDPKEFKGTITALDVANQAFTLLPEKGGASLTFTVTSQSKIKKNGKTATYSALALGDKVSTKYVPVSMLVTSLEAEVKLIEFKGTITALDAANQAFTLLSEKDSTSLTLTVTSQSKIKKNGKTAAFSALALGDKVSAKYVPVSMLVSSLEAEVKLKEVKKGVISAINPTNSSLTVALSNGTSLTLVTNSQTEIKRNGKKVTFSAISVGDSLKEAKYVPVSMLITKMELTGSTATPPPPTATPVPTSTPTPTSTPPSEHSAMTSYDGPQTCINCHQTSAESALHSEHMQWTGKWTQINTYCTAPIQSEYACLNCHAGTGKITNMTTQDVDCLICHSDAYKRVLAPKSPINVVDWQGNPRTVMVPEKVNGEYQFQPVLSPGVTILDIARSVTKPTTATCLRCHARAGGGNGSKRGDIFAELASPTLAPAVDVHLSPTGANLSCLSCHKASNHQIPGKGIDLRVSEGGSVDCTQCHNQKLHTNPALNQHTDRVACQTCHIPTFGKVVGTEMSRDWRIPFMNPNGLDGQGAWVGGEVRQSNVIPTYKFWNKQSFVYSAGNALAPEADGSYVMAKALGSINDGKLYPIKVHTAFQPVQDGTNIPVMYDVLWNFLTGKYEEAAQRGLAVTGAGGGTYSWALFKTDQLITHGVEPKQSSVQCAACHDTRTQVDLRTLGYQLKGDPAVVCTQCHETEVQPGFYSLHNEHVTKKSIDCSMCHLFSRPERNLIIGIVND